MVHAAKGGSAQMRIARKKKKKGGVPPYGEGKIFAAHRAGNDPSTSFGAKGE